MSLVWKNASESASLYTCRRPFHKRGFSAVSCVRVCTHVIIAKEILLRHVTYAFVIFKIWMDVGSKGCHGRVEPAQDVSLRDPSSDPCSISYWQGETPHQSQPACPQWCPAGNPASSACFRVYAVYCAPVKLPSWESPSWLSG